MSVTGAVGHEEVVIVRANLDVRAQSEAQYILTRRIQHRIADRDFGLLRIYGVTRIGPDNAAVEQVAAATGDFHTDPTAARHHRPDETAAGCILQLDRPRQAVPYHYVAEEIIAALPQTDTRIGTLHYQVSYAHVGRAVEIYRDDAGRVGPRIIHDRPARSFVGAADDHHQRPGIAAVQHAEGEAVGIWIGPGIHENGISSRQVVGVQYCLDIRHGLGRIDSQIR